MNKKIIASLLVGGVIALTTACTYAAQGNPGMPNADCTDPVRKAEVEAMFANKDYAAFQSLYADKGISKRVTTQEQFLGFVALRNAQLAGDTATADKLKSELGLGQRKQDGTGNKMWKGTRGQWQGRNK